MSWFNGYASQASSGVVWSSADARAVAIILQGRTMLPARFVAEQLGCAVNYDPTTRVVTITYPKP